MKIQLPPDIRCIVCNETLWFFYVCDNCWQAVPREDVRESTHTMGREERCPATHLRTMSPSGSVRSSDPSTVAKVHNVETTLAGRSGVCNSCAEWFPALEMDHELPRFAGGPHDTSNIQWLCNWCHKLKTQLEKEIYDHYSVHRLHRVVLLAVATTVLDAPCGDKPGQEPERIIARTG